MDQQEPFIGPPRHPVDALKAMQIHPARGPMLRSQSLGRSYWVLETNADELKEWINGFENVKGLAVLIMHRGGLDDPGDMMQGYLDELSRRWHNYQASASTLVDHTRRLKRKESESFQQAYDGKLADLRDLPLVRFTGELRNYLLHKGWPNTMLSLDLGPNEEHRISCSATELLKDFDWRSIARGFLEERQGSTDNIRLVSLVDEYLQTIQTFYDWFWEAHYEEHKELVASYRALEQEYDRIIPPTEPMSAQGITLKRPGVSGDLVSWLSRSA